MDHSDDAMPSATESYDDSFGDDAEADTDEDGHGFAVVAANRDGEARSDGMKNYTILTEADIRRLQDDDVSQLSATLSISKSDSCLLLRHYNWNVTKVHDEWFTDEAKVRDAVGLIETPAAIAADESVCEICFDSHLCREMSAADCGHQFCGECWRGYIGTSISDGPACLDLRCPDPRCSAAVRQEMVDSLVCEEDKEKYSRYLIRSYVEDNKKAKWCPARGCEFIVSFDVGSENYNVCCRCGHSFCWNCAEEAHRPVDCETVKKWIMKNGSESENAIWILANSKACPKCRRPIEKNSGCMHMTCRPPCGFHFCWLCLSPWSVHGYGGCNRYEEGERGEEHCEEDRRRKRAKISIDRYTHYWERWAANRKSLNKAISDRERMRAEKLEKLRDKLDLAEPQVKFVTEAWDQIVECRRVLTWTYAYGYYLDEQEKAKREFFEYLQEEAEAGLERLHRSAEIDLEVYFDRKCTLSGTSKEFVDFRGNLVWLTSVTRNYFENLVRALENGLQEVNSWKTRRNKAKINKGIRKIAPFGGAIAVHEDGQWACTTCTYVNSIAFNTCELCETDRYK